MSSTVDEQLKWQAMQYVLGELSEADRVAFEERMVDDLAVCEAVTVASRLVLTTQAVLSVPTIAPQAMTTRPVRGSWTAVLLTSAAMAMLCLIAVRVPLGPETDSKVAKQDPQAAELVSLWRSGTDDDDESDELEDSMADASESVPGWMLAAVSLETPVSIDGGSEKVQEN